MYIKEYAYICTDTGSYLLNDGNYHKYQIMFVEVGNFNCEQIWVHGIGSLRDPIFEPLGGCIYLMYQQAIDVCCFFINDTLVYEWNYNPFFQGCEGSNIGIDDFENKHHIFKIYPNPTNAELFIETNLNVYEITIYNVLNTMLYNNIIYNKNASVDTQNLSPGVYFVKVQSPNKNYSVKKFIKY